MNLYTLCWASSFILSILFTPVAKRAAIYFGIMDWPDQKLKTHRGAVPYLGGVAILAAFILSLTWIRVLTHFPTGTLKSTRGIFLGALIVALIGLVDDCRGGLHYRTKFFLQAVAAWVLILFDVRIKFAHPEWLANALTLLWVIGITNAFNIIDIMDGLAGGVAAIASLAFLFISLPTEEIYVNFASAALAGACMGFLPYNLSDKNRIFMGDAGSLTLGYILSALSMGTSYTKINNMGLFAPLLILALPIYDTALVMILRIRKGQSPFLGSKDHFPLRLLAMGFAHKQILLICYSGSVITSVGAYLLTRLPPQGSLAVIASVLVLIGAFSWKVSKVRI